jgi:hypothetical protein
MTENTSTSAPTRESVLKDISDLIARIDRLQQIERTLEQPESVDEETRKVLLHELMQDIDDE